MNLYKIILGFIIMLLIVVFTSIFTVNKMEQLTENTKKIYDHPFTVSNAVANIQTSIAIIHRNMKDLTTIENQKDILLIATKIKDEENIVYKNFETIYNFYLGNKGDIDQSYKLFNDWQIIKDEIIHLMLENRFKEAVEINKEKSTLQVQRISKQIDILRNFAYNKANEIYNDTMKRNGIDTVILVMFFAFLVSLLIIAFIFYYLLKANRQNHKQLFLIDQNILFAKFTKNGELINISQALCRILNKKKNEILHETHKYFFTSDEQFKQFENHIYSGKEYHGEVHFTIEDKKIWFDVEIIPELNYYYEIESFSLFLTNISDKKQIEKVSITDTLTGLYNRNYFEIIFDKEVRRAKRDEKDLTFIMFDVDYFKQYNDSYGHQEGDNTLKAVSNILKKHTNRSYDHAFRIGGEEFIILAYHDTFDDAKRFTNIILQEIEEMKIPHKNSKISNFVTASAGCVQFKKTHLLNNNEMFKRVDHLLYQSKQSGRNQVTYEIIE